MKQTDISHPFDMTDYFYVWATASGDLTFHTVILNSFQNLKKMLKQACPELGLRILHDNPADPLQSLFLRFTEDKLLGIEGFGVTKARSGGFWMKFDMIVSVWLNSG